MLIEKGSCKLFRFPAVFASCYWGSKLQEAALIRLRKDTQSQHHLEAVQFKDCFEVKFLEFRLDLVLLDQEEFE